METTTPTSPAPQVGQVYPDLVAPSLKKFADSQAKALSELYSFTDFTVQVATRPDLFTVELKATDSVNGFVYSFGETYEQALDSLKKQMTPLAEIKSKKLAAARKMLAEAESLP